MKSSFKLIIAIVVSELAGIIGSIFTVSAIPAWYATLEKPLLNPPSWVFGPVWTTLYALMGIAAFLVWNKEKTWKPGRSDTRIALAIFAFQLILNSIWSIVFFRFESPLGAFIVIVALWIAIVATIASFYRISKAAAWLLVPYLLWVSFASYLNYSIWALN